MLGWIDRVVPQPPAIPPMPVVVEEVTMPEPEAKKAKSGDAQKPSEAKSSCPEKGSEIKEAIAPPDPVSTSESSGQGVLSWLSQGLERVIPQPIQNASGVQQEEVKTSEASTQTETLIMEDEEKPEPEIKEAIAPPDPVTTTESSGPAVLTWLSQGLGKVIPQPSQNASGPQEDAKSSELETQKMEKEEKPGTTATDPSGGEEVLQSISNDPEKTGGKKLFTRLLEGFEKMIPHSENVKKTEEATPEEPIADQAEPSGTPGGKRPVAADTQSVMSISLFDGDGGSMLKRFFRGLEKAIPHPVSKAKQDGQDVESGDVGPGQEKNKGT